MDRWDPAPRVMMSVCMLNLIDFFFFTSKDGPSIIFSFTCPQEEVWPDGPKV